MNAHTNPPRAFIKANSTETLDIGEVLLKVAKTEEINGVKICVYAEGWSDQRVLDAVKDKVRPGLPVRAIENLRRARYGLLRVPQPPPPAPAPAQQLELPIREQRLSRLEGLVRSIEGTMHTLSRKIDEFAREHAELKTAQVALSALIEEVKNAEAETRIGLANLKRNHAELQGHTIEQFQRLAVTEKKVGITYTPKTKLGAELMKAGYINGSDDDRLKR